MADAIYVKTSPRVLIRRGPPGPTGATGPQGPTGSSGSGTIDSTTNLLAGDGAGAGVDSTIDPADVTDLIANNTGVNTGDQDLSGLVPTTRTVNGHALSADVTVTPGDLGLVIGTNVQAYDAELAAIAGLTSAADKGIQFTGTGTAATYDLTAAGKALLDDAAASDQRTTLSAAASGANTDITSVLLNQTGLVVKGASSNALTIKPNETLSAGRTLNIVTNDASRTVTVSGDTTISGTNTGDQTNVSGSSATAAALSVSGQTGLVTVTGITSTSRVKTVRDAADTLLELGGNYTPTGTWTNLAMVTPTLGTPVSGNLSNCTGITATSAAALSVSGQIGLFTVTGLASTNRTKTVRDAADTILELGGSYTPTGTWTSLTMVTPVLGTPTSGTLTNCTFPTLNQNTTGSAASLSVASQTGKVTVTGLASVDRIKTVRDAADTILELGGSYTTTGTWTNQTHVTPVLGTPTSGTLTSCTGLPISTGVSGLGTGIATALAVNTGAAGAPVLFNGALGTPTSGTLTSCTFPTLNQNTSGSAASLSVSGQTGLITLTGTTSTSRTKTVRDAADTILELGGSYTPTGTWTSLTMVTPVLGTPTSGTLTNCTGLPVAGITASTSTALGVGSIELGHATQTTLTGSAGVLSVEGTVVPTISSTSTFTNKRITKRVGSTASSATPSIDSDSYDMYKITALAAAITSLTITGTPTDGQSLILVIIDDGTARAIAFGTTTQVASSDLAFPTTTVLSKYLYCTFIYNSVLTKWVMTGKLSNI